MRLRSVFLAPVLIFVVAGGQTPIASAQAPATTSTSTSQAPSKTASSTTTKSVPDQVLDQLVKEFDLLRKKKPGSEKEFATSETTYIPYLVAPAATTQLFNAFQEQRVDVQVTSSQSAGSSTSTTNKGSVPWLFGLAVEDGALTQSTTNGQIVLRGNIANAISAMKYQDYVTSFNKIQEQNALVRNIAAISFSITFDPSKATNSAASPTTQTNNFSGFSIHYDIWNHRDPRDQRWRASWASTIKDLTAASNAAEAFLAAFDKPSSTQWEALAAAQFGSLSPSASDDQIRTMFKTLGDDLAEKVKTAPQIISAAQSDVSSLIQAGKEKTEIYSEIMRSPTLSFEYTYVRQSTNQIPGSTSTTTTSVASPLPNLSTFNVIFNTHLFAGSQLSLNGVATIFNSLPVGAKGGSIRDAEVTAQVDIPLPQISKVGKPTLTFSGLYMDLINQPLGQPLLVNGVPESRTGNIGLFQGKFTIPAGKGSGVSVPLSFTYSNRTELIKQSDVRGSIGVTFNLDSIFSKP